LKELACDRLLEQRVETKLTNRHIATSMNRLHLAMPVPRDTRDRPPFIPPSVAEKKSQQKELKTKLSKEEQEELEFLEMIDIKDDLLSNKHEQRPLSFGGVTFHTHSRKTLADQNPEDWDPTIFGPDWRSEYLLADDSWKYDPIPEIIDGKNIADYIDPEILERLEQLEREEEEREAQVETDMVMAQDDADYDELNEEEAETLKKIQDKKTLIVQQHRMRKNLIRNKPIVPRTKLAPRSNQMMNHLESIGIDSRRAVKRARSQSRARSMERSRSSDPQARSSRSRSRSSDPHRSASIVSTEDGRKRIRLSLSKSRERSQSVTPGDGFKDAKQKEKAIKLHKDRGLKLRNRQARRGEGDRHIPDLKPKHLFAGKRGIGANQRR